MTDGHPTWEGAPRPGMRLLLHLGCSSAVSMKLDGDKWGPSSLDLEEGVTQAWLPILAVCLRPNQARQKALTICYGRIMTHPLFPVPSACVTSRCKRDFEDVMERRTQRWDCPGSWGVMMSLQGSLQDGHRRDRARRSWDDGRELEEGAVLRR